MIFPNNLHEPKRSWETYSEVCQRQRKRLGLISSILLLAFCLFGLLPFIIALWAEYGK